MAQKEGRDVCEKRIGCLALLVALVAVAAGCVDITNAGRDVAPPTGGSELLGAGAACSVDNQCASGLCTAGRCE